MSAVAKHGLERELLGCGRTRHRVMCGIVGYVGSGPVVPLLVAGNRPGPLLPLMEVVLFQLAACPVARLRACDVDQPRNLAESVTVE